jgi:hypothetical protein
MLYMVDSPFGRACASESSNMHIRTESEQAPFV